MNRKRGQIDRAMQLFNRDCLWLQGDSGRQHERPGQERCGQNCKRETDGEVWQLAHGCLRGLALVLVVNHGSEPNASLLDEPPRYPEISSQGAGGPHVQVRTKPTPLEPDEIIFRRVRAPNA